LWVFLWVQGGYPPTPFAPSILLMPSPGSSPSFPFHPPEVYSIHCFKKRPCHSPPSSHSTLPTLRSLSIHLARTLSRSTPLLVAQLRRDWEPAPEQQNCTIILMMIKVPYLYKCGPHSVSDLPHSTSIMILMTNNGMAVRSMIHPIDVANVVEKLLSG
jgi:hypothetical protein